MGFITFLHNEALSGIYTTIKFNACNNIFLKLNQWRDLNEVSSISYVKHNL